jgi:hypothetical protein
VARCDERDGTRAIAGTTVFLRLCSGPLYLELPPRAAARTEAFDAAIRHTHWKIIPHHCDSAAVLEGGTKRPDAPRLACDSSTRVLNYVTFCRLYAQELCVATVWR